MNSSYYKDKVVVITGGSSGIGFALAKEFAQQSARLFLIARDKERLEASKLLIDNLFKQSCSVAVIAADVSCRDEITNTINAIGNEFGKIDLLINCAGIIRCGRFNDQSIAEMEKCLAVNFLGAVYSSKAAWQHLKTAQGQLSFVSSVAGYVGLPGYASYTPPKFAMAGLAECLYFEGKDEGIRVSIIYPPDTETPLLEYERKHTLPESRALSKNIKVKSPEEVARIYVRGLQSNKHEIYCDNGSRWLRWFKNNFFATFRYAAERVIRRSKK